MRSGVVGISGASARASMATLALLVACIVAMRLHLYHQPLDRDTTNYAVLAREWSHGRTLYTDLWLHSPPGIVWAYRLAAMVGGDGTGQMFVLGLVCAVATLLAIYISVIAATANRTGAIWAALFWTLFSGSLPLFCSQPNCEAVMVLCVSVAVACLVIRPKSKWIRWLLIVVAGLCLALDSLVKQVTLPLAAAVAVAMVVWPARPGSRTRALAEACVLMGTLSLAWLALLLQLKLNGTLQAFWHLNVEFNLAYSRVSGSDGMLTNLLHLLRAPIPSVNYDRRWLSALLVVSTALACSLRSTASSNVRALLVATAAGSLVALALPGNFFPHYYQLIVPNICIAIGIVAGASVPWTRIRTVVLAALAGVVFWGNDRYYHLPADQWATEEFHDPVDTFAFVLQQQLVSILKPGETFYEWGDEPQLYFYTGCSSPTGFLFNCTTLGDRRFMGPWTDAQTDRALADLNRVKPAYFVLNLSQFPPSANPRINAWLAKTYSKSVCGYGCFVVYRR